MSELVTVVDHLYERQGVKVVLEKDGSRDVPPGELPAPGDDFVLIGGEPAFTVTFDTPLASDEDIPADAAAALHRAAGRLGDVHPDGVEDPDRDMHVEWVDGPRVSRGVVEIRLDTDDNGYTPAMIDTMARILVEELTPLGVRAHVGAAGFRS